MKELGYKRQVFTVDKDNIIGIKNAEKDKQGLHLINEEKGVLYYIREI